MGNVLAAARELLQQRHFDDVIEACQTALAVVPNHVGLRLLLAESLMNLRRDGEAQAEVAAALRTSPACPDAFRLLGTLAYRRDELRAAETFLLQALRVAPQDRSISQLLDKVKQRKTPAAAAAKLPAASAAAGTSHHGTSYPSIAPIAAPRPRARGTEPASTYERQASLRPEPRNVPQPIVARGSAPVDKEPATTVEPHTGSVEVDMDFDANTTTDHHPLTTVDDNRLDDGLTNELASAPPRKQPWVRPDTDHGEPTRAKAARPTGPSESVALRLGPGNLGFGEYLVMTGVLTRWQLYRVLQVQDWKNMRVGEAAVELGYISAKRVRDLLHRFLAVREGFAPYPESVHDQDTVA